MTNYLGVTPQAISRWESETGYPDIELLPLIADFFEVTIDELKDYEEYTSILVEGNEYKKKRLHEEILKCI